MGQYYYIVNIDKMEYLHPHEFDDGLKLMEFGCSRDGTLTGLTLLLSNGNGRGGGDMSEAAGGEMDGRWAGDRIVIAGDYGDEGKFLDQVDIRKSVLAAMAEENGAELNLHHVAHEHFTDISEKVCKALEACGVSPRDRR
jgi:hypothetical protein